MHSLWRNSSVYKFNKKKNIKNVYYSFYDVDNRTGKKSSQILLKNNIKTSLILNNNYTDFYQSYFENKKNSLPLVDGKIAISQDCFKSFRTNTK